MGSWWPEAEPVGERTSVVSRRCVWGAVGRVLLVLRRPAGRRVREAEAEREEEEALPQWPRWCWCCCCDGNGCCWWEASTGAAGTRMKVCTEWSSGETQRDESAEAEEDEEEDEEVELERRASSMAGSRFWWEERSTRRT